MFKNIKVIYFDFDDVLGYAKNSYHLNRILKVKQERFNNVIKETLFEFKYRYQYLPTIEHEKQYFNDYYSSILKKLNLNNSYLKTMINSHFSNRKNLHTGVSKMLNILSAKYKLGMITNAFPSRRIFEFDILNISRFFDNDKIVISSETGFWKPSPEIFRIAIKKSGVNPNEILFIDNDSENLDGAKFVGIHNLVQISPIPHLSNYPSIPQVKELPKLLSD